MRGQRKRVKETWQGEREGKEEEGCQRQGGLLTLNGSLVRKVEGEEVQIKDVPSVKRKSSFPSVLNCCLNGEKEREPRRGKCLY